MCDCLYNFSFSLALAINVVEFFPSSLESDFVC